MDARTTTMHKFVCGLRWRNSFDHIICEPEVGQREFTQRVGLKRDRNVNSCDSSLANRLVAGVKPG